MKNCIFKMLFVASFLGLASCSNDEIYTPQEVDLTLDYTFAESGSMTRATGEEVYGGFYEKYIKSKLLTPKNYTITFKEKTTGAYVIIRGIWGEKNGLRLTEGDYVVTGTSHPLPQDNTSFDEISDSVFISFSEEVHITKDMTALTLTAKYDSYLLMFDTEQTSKASYVYNTYSKDLKSCDGIYTLFVNSLTWGNSENIIYLNRKNGKTVLVSLDKFPFEKGKYYYFNDMTNSFDIPKMESGN